MDTKQSTGRDKFKRMRGLLSLFTKVILILPRFVRIFLWDCTSRYSQIVFIGVRYILLKSLIKECGDNVRIGSNVQIINWDKISIKSNVSIHANCYIDAAGGIEIGNNVSIAHNSTILSTNHDWSDSSIPIKYNPIIANKVIIHDDVWIGCGCRVLSGVSVFSRSIIAAGAVVTKNVESNTIVGGIPARVIKEI